MVAYKKHVICGAYYEPENRIQLVYKRKRKHVVTPNAPNREYLEQVIRVSFPRESSNTTMVGEPQQLTCNLDFESSKNKERSVGVNNISRGLVAKKTLYLGSTELEVTKNSDIFDVYRELYLTKKQREIMYLHSIQAENGLKARVGAKSWWDKLDTHY